MAATARNKQGKSSHLQLVRPERTPEQWLDLEFQEGIAALEVRAGRRRPRRFYKIAESEMHPLRVLARVIDDGLTAKVPADALVGLAHRCLKRYVARKTRTLVQHDTGEWRPAA